MHIRQPEAAALVEVGQAFVVNAQQAQLEMGYAARPETVGILPLTP